MDKVLVVYSKRTLVPRRVVIPDNDAELVQAVASLHAAEAHLVQDRQHMRRAFARTGAIPARKMVADHHGVQEQEIPSGRCAVVANGKVVHVVMADPEIDQHPDGQLIESDTANVGDQWNGKEFSST